MEKDKIEAGEYIRTKKKGIFKVLSIRKTPYGYYCGTVDNDKIKTITIGKGGSAEIKNDIVKHSKNIIDLIEVGDYVNGDKVVNEIWGEDDNNLYFETEGGYNKTYIGEKDIKSIATKEQMKEMEYRL